MLEEADDSLARERARLAWPYVATAVAMMVGVMLGAALPWGRLWLIGAAGPVAGMWVMLLRGRRRGALAWGLVAVVVLMAGWQAWRAERVGADHIGRYVTQTAQLAELTGTVVQPAYEPRRDLGAFAAFDYRPPIALSVLAVDGVVVGPGRAVEPASGRVLLHVGEADHRLRRGQRIRAMGWLAAVQPPSNPGEFDYSQHLLDQGVVGRLSLPRRGHWQLIDEPALWIPATTLLSLREGLTATLQRSLGLGMDADERSLALLEALLLGIWGRELADTYESFRRVGLAHLLAISGAHLGILLALVWLIVRLFVPHPRRAAVIVLVVLGVYLLALPVRLPIVRAAIMAAVFGVGYASGRRLPGLAMLAIAAMVVLLWRPGDLFTPGFQLSFGIVAGLILFTRPVRRWLWPMEAGRLGDMHTADQAEPTRLADLLLHRGADYAAANIVAFIIATPIVAYHFQLVSPLAFVMSLLSLPVVTVLLGLGYLKMLVGMFVPSASMLLAGPLAWASDVLLALVDHAQGWPGAWVELTRPPSVAWVVGALIAGTAAMAGWYAGRRRALVASAAVVLLWAVAVDRDWAGWVHPAREAPALSLHSFSVGAGAAHLVRFDGRAILFDCGSQTYPLMGLRTVVPGLHRLAVRRLDTVFISHAHLDHFNGLLELADRVPVGEVLVPPAMWREAHERPWRAAGVLLAGLRERGIPVHAVHRGWSRQHDDTHLRLLWPTADFASENVNDTSLVLAVDHQSARRRVLLTGDIGADAVAGLLALEPDLHADIVEMPHHGEYTDASITLLATLKPAVLVQSSDRARLRRDRWPAQLQSLGLDHLPRLTTATHGMVTVHILPDGTLAHQTYRTPRVAVAAQLPASSQINNQQSTTPSPATLSGMYEITIERTFAASHAIRLPDGKLEPVHGHNWPVTLTVERDELDSIETVMDFHDLERIVDALITPFHNRHLNDLPPFADGTVNPTAERVAWWIGTQTAAQLPAGVRLQYARVGEAPGCWATYRPTR